jgi:Flp pilus assembly protein TadG
MKQCLSERGAELVEMAIVTPILLLVFAGIAESGLLLRSFEVTVNAAREGARLAVLPGNEMNGYAVVIARVNNYLAEANVTSATDPTPPAVNVTQEAIPIGAGVTANGVRVTVTYQYDCLFLGPVLGLLNGTFQNTITYQSTALMRTQVAAVGL